MKTSLLLWGLVATLVSATAEMRTWTSASDPFKTFEGEMTALNGDKITIKRPDGKTLTTTLDKFSPADVAFAKQSGGKPSGTEDKSATPAKPETKTEATGAAGASAVPADSDLSKIKLGTPVEGLTSVKMEDLGGKVVLLEYWGTR